MFINISVRKPQGAARVDERAPLAAPAVRGRPRGRGRRGPGRREALRVDGGGTESVEELRDELNKRGLPGKSILGDYFQENMTSRSDSFG